MPPRSYALRESRLLPALGAAMLLAAFLFSLGGDAEEATDDSTVPIAGTDDAAPIIQPSDVADVIRAPDDLKITSASFDGRRIWVIATEQPAPGRVPAERATVFSLDPESGEEITRTQLAEGPFEIAADPVLGVWVSQQRTGKVTALDAATGAIVGEIGTQHLGDVDRSRLLPVRIRIWGGWVWLLRRGGTLERFRDTSGPIDVFASDRDDASDFVATDAGVWLTFRTDRPIMRLDPSAGSWNQLDLMLGDPHSLSVHDGRVQVVFRSIEGVDSLVTSIESDRVAIAPSERAVVFSGWVDGSFGILDAAGTFHAASPADDTLTNWKPSWDADGAMTIGEQTWFIDGGSGNVLARLRRTEPAPEALPIPIPENLQPRVIDDPFVVSPDWTALNPGFLAPDVSASIVWSGEEFLVDDGNRAAAYDPDLDSWRLISPGPVSASESQVTRLWAGDELLVWDRTTAAAWDPGTDTWRTIEDWPLHARLPSHVVWTGAEVLDLDAWLRVDPVDGSARQMSDRYFNERSTLVWTGAQVVMVPSGAAYDPSTDTWTPPVGGRPLTELAAAGTWIDGRVVAADYLMRAAEFDPTSTTWTSLAPVPLEQSECGPSVVAVAGTALIQNCSELALAYGEAGGWVPLAGPTATAGQPFSIVSTGETVYAWGSGGFYRLEDHALMEGPQRLIVGSHKLDMPPGWRLLEAGTLDAESDQAIFVLVSDGSEGCFVTSTATSAEAAVRALLDSSEPGYVQPIVGGAVQPVLRYSTPPDQSHVMWVASSNETIDVSCSSVASADLVAPHVWYEWESS